MFDRTSPRHLPGWLLFTVAILCLSGCRTGGDPSADVSSSTGAETPDVASALNDPVGAAVATAMAPIEYSETRLSVLVEATGLAARCTQTEYVKGDGIDPASFADLDVWSEGGPHELSDDLRVALEERKAGIPGSDEPSPAQTRGFAVEVADDCSTDVDPVPTLDAYRSAAQNWRGHVTELADEPDLRRVEDAALECLDEALVAATPGPQQPLSNGQATRLHDWPGFRLTAVSQVGLTAGLYDDAMGPNGLPAEPPSLQQQAKWIEQEIPLAVQMETDWGHALFDCTRTYYEEFQSRLEADRPSFIDENGVTIAKYSEELANLGFTP